MAQPYPSFTPTYHHDQYPLIDPTQFDCSNKIVVITGAGRGIGQAIAIAFAQAKAKGIALIGRTESTLKETASKIKEINPSIDTFHIIADITSAEQIKSAFSTISSHYSHVPDILVQNAGGLAKPGHITDLTPDELWSTFELNTKGPLLVCTAFLHAASASATNTTATPRTIINISSGTAVLPYAPTAATYSTSKLAMAKMIEYLSHEHPTWRIVNLQPGVVDTDLARAAGRKAPDSTRLPAGTAVWLACDPRAQVLSGRFIWANWDLSEVLEREKEVVDGGLLRLGLKGWADGESVESMVERAMGVHGNAGKDEGKDE